MEERSLEMIEVSREGGRRWCRQESGLQILWKKGRENLSRLSLSEFKLATNKTLGYFYCYKCYSYKQVASGYYNTNSVYSSSHDMLYSTTVQWCHCVYCCVTKSYDYAVVA